MDEAEPVSAFTFYSQRKSRITFEDLAFKLGRFAFSPQAGTMLNAIKQRSSVGPEVTLERARNANKFAFDAVARDANDGIAMTAHIDKGNVRR
jgi:hypothetical protein